MHSELVATERTGDCLVVRLNRPDDGNAISLAVAEALSAVVAEAAANTSLRSMVITGAGSRFFCTGGDVKAYAKLGTAADLNEVFDFVRDLLDSIESLRFPVIAAINGYALGGGAELALACDLRIMDVSAQIGFPQSRLGILPGWDGIERMLPLIGRAATTRLLLTGTRVRAEEARAIGLVDEVVADGQCIARALELALTIGETAPLSSGAIKTALRDAWCGDAPGARMRAREAFARLWFTADHKEAEKAFAEKRAPRFAGH